MRQIQVILTVNVTNDEYSLLCNKNSKLTLDTLIAYKIDDKDSLSFGLPALLLDLGANEPGYPEELSHREVRSMEFMP